MRALQKAMESTQHTLASNGLWWWQYKHRMALEVIHVLFLHANYSHGYNQSKKD
jgi:hypothetical protein